MNQRETRLGTMKRIDLEVKTFMVFFYSFDLFYDKAEASKRNIVQIE